MSWKTLSGAGRVGFLAGRLAARRDACMYTARHAPSVAVRADQVRAARCFNHQMIGELRHARLRAAVDMP